MESPTKQCGKNLKLGMPEDMRVRTMRDDTYHNDDEAEASDGA